MKIYFDGVLLNEDYYTSLKMSYKMFDENDNFKLGITPCKALELGVYKDANIPTPTNVTIEINDTIYGSYGIDSVEDHDYETIYKITDKMVDFNFKYDASPIIKASTTQDNGVPYVTLKQLLEDICLKANITLHTQTFLGMDKHISWYDNTVTAREYIGYIAELNGGYAVINKVGEIELKQFNNTPKATISLDEVDSYQIGEKHIIKHVVYDNGIGNLWEYGTGENTLYLNANNVYITSEEDVLNIYNTVKDFEFNTISVGQCLVQDVSCGECIEYTDGTNSYKTIAQYDLDYFGGWIGGYNFKVNTNKEEQTTEYIGSQPADKVRRLKTEVDRLNNEIRILSEQIVDISTTEEGFGKIPFTNASKGALSNITITGDVQKLYPATPQNGSIATKSGIYKSGMAVASSDKPYIKAEYPSATLFSKDSYLIIRQADKEDVIYHLPINHLNVSGNVSDEFQWNFGDMKIIRKVGVLPTGEHYPLATPNEEILGNLEIAMPEGDGEIIFKCYPNAKIKATYMFKNEYTETVSTKVETKSQIKVASDNINLSVDKKIEDVNESIAAVDVKADNINLSVQKKADKDKIISQINLSPEEIAIDSNKISLQGKSINMTSDNIAINSTNFNVDKDGNMRCNNADIKGKVESTEGNIAGWNINSEGFFNGNVFVKNNGYSTVYTYADIVIVRNYLNGKLSFNEQDIERYDFNNNGEVDSGDLLYLRHMILGIV